MEEIRNKVAESGLITLDLEAIYPEIPCAYIDISQWLDQGLLLREKQFRVHLKEHDWSIYTGKAVGVYCSTEAIVPQWAYLLLQTYLTDVAHLVEVGKEAVVLRALFKELIDNLDFQAYEDARVIIKGCSKKQVPQVAYLYLISKLQPLVKSLMFGEACSTVPLYKRK